MTLLESRSLHVQIGAITVCRSLDFALATGECWGMLGANGAGKTTLLHTLAGLRRAAGGSVCVQGRPVEQWPRKQLARELGVLFQDSHDAFPARVLDTALSGRYPHLPFWSLDSAADIEIARASLAEVCLDSLWSRDVESLSGGERRRLAIATVLTQAPRLWLLDEPTNHLDLQFQIRLLQLVQTRVQQCGGALLMTLHDVNLVLRFCSHAMLLMEGEEPLCGPVDEIITAGNLERLYHYPVVSLHGDDGRRLFYPR